MTSTLQGAKETVSTLALTTEEPIKNTFSKPHRIDTHIHIIPPSFAKAVSANGGDPAGWDLPTWNTAGTIHAMNTLAIQTGVMAESISKFYYDVALSTSPIALQSLLEFTTPDKILYGSDFPYGPLPVGLFMTAQLDEFMRERPEEGKKLEGLNRENAEKLFGDNVKW
ncbi:uncharacterized protein STEHIDRAFT_158953 [Stereum hirsutum FP-91666 SS1]|uniref:uncharacterized protein n=1 Tax=Stereum hirsutum (strain FP-91666) TaxID=721885 RepID=UPI0004449EE5|nr:uncharacterized protein STEHIDRAFT_158953 [Stereum hirsutum FP-91666 SS1]EIM84267.1 hypothetical protein STEHIDRAFT_158953 [Stereum hirsutum FP-91666 SS1]